MLLRNKEKCIEHHKELEAGLKATQEVIARNIEGGEYDLAGINCDKLKAQLEQINQFTNHMADMGF
ncbi:hypothetical protein [Burkholderia ambifaria]|jgi:hypothetical protein|uniref:hypothetical protein n=1 Tax=Burkholderia ambifaria TaxID=152480 RepID=UPI000F8140F0|nr:hypothetical protein [Burkholderia ambifaria]